MHSLPKCYGMEKADKSPNSISPHKIGTDPPNSLESQLDKVKLGDSAAFAEIYDQYAARIYGFASHMIGSREDAEDITQDTFFLALSRNYTCKYPCRRCSWSRKARISLSRIRRTPFLPYAEHHEVPFL